MPEKPKKKIPCEGNLHLKLEFPRSFPSTFYYLECRDQKRKCNGEIPCERCGKFNLSCVYTVTRSPKDEEYLALARKVHLEQQIDYLNDQIKGMEDSIYTMRGSNYISSPPTSVPTLLDDLTDFSLSSSSSDDTSSLICYGSIDDHRPFKRTKVLATAGKDISAFLSIPLLTDQEEKEYESKVKPWTLTFQKGNVCIRTHVATHTDLLNNLHHMMGTVELIPTIPARMFNSSGLETSVLGVLGSLVRKKYGKTHCKNVAKSLQIFITPDLSSVDTMVIAKAPDTIRETTTKLIRAYLQCQHLQQLAVHARTFIRLFIEDKYTDSPAAMALCAAICTFRCAHVAECLPSISLVEYGKFYFDRARDLLSDLFDQIDLETFTSYTFMAVYKLTISQRKEALVYADMAERLAVVLEPGYLQVLKNDDCSLEAKGEAVHFKRVLNHLHRVLTYEQVSRLNSENDQLKFKLQDLPFCTLIHKGEGKWEMAQDDSVQEKWFVQMHLYILELQRSLHEASRAAQALDLHQLVGHIGHQVEMAMRHWYSRVLPPEFKLSMPLFDSEIGIQDFYTTLDRECAHSAIPVLTTLALYEEFIVLGQSYVPKNLPSPETDWRRINDMWKGGVLCVDQSNKKWQRRIDKLMVLRKQIEFEGTDEDFLKSVNTMLGVQETRVDNTVLKLGIHSAFITVRLIKYLRSRAQDCYFDIKILINAWQILLSVSRLQPVLQPDVACMIPRIHENLKACMEIVKDELKLQPFQGTVGDYVAVMEKDLKTEIFEDDDDCDCVACPNA